MTFSARLLLPFLAFSVLLPQSSVAAGVNDVPDVYGKTADDWKITIHPILGWMPVLGVDINLPVPPGGGGTHPEAKLSSSINGALFAGYTIEKGKWSTTGNFLWAGLSADKSTPVASLDMDLYYGQAMVGRQILPGLSLEGGVRRLAIKFTATIDPYPSVSRKPGVWDPLVGLTYRKHLSDKWLFNLHADGGGFGVGSDVDVAANTTVEWHFAKHFGTSFGYGALHFDVTNDKGLEQLRVKQTIHGPILGFGIYF